VAYLAVNRMEVCKFQRHLFGRGGRREVVRFWLSLGGMLLQATFSKVMATLSLENPCAPVRTWMVYIGIDLCYFLKFTIGSIYNVGICRDNRKVSLRERQFTARLKSALNPTYPYTIPLPILVLFLYHSYDVVRMMIDMNDNRHP